MSDDVSRAGIPQQHCGRLRCKEMFIDTGREFDITDTGSGIFWCSHTQTCVGPDGSVADPEHCKAGRGCYQSL